MLVLLPPSEGKSAPADGPVLDLRALSLQPLTPARDQVLDALAALCCGDPVHARSVLGLSPRLADEVARDAALRLAPTAPAAQVYTGVLYRALGHHELDGAARGWVDERVLVWSGLWGAVRLGDRIPAYRLASSVTLPPLGRLATFWRVHLASALDDLAVGQVVLDLRSGTYASSWLGPAATTVVGRVIHDRAGTRRVASHFNKATKGRVVRALAEQGARPETTDELVDAVRSAGFRAELGASPSGSPARPRELDIVVTAL